MTEETATDSTTHGTASARGLSFGPAAARYDDLRPGYPAEALRWALGDEPVRVVDLGAGTGILTRNLRALGHEVIAVEPDELMRAHLAAANPGVTALAGRAERIPLPAGSVDAVVAGQAYHWFDPEPAHAEVARVLKPGGVFAPLWNRRDEIVPWVAELSAISDDDTAGRGIREPVPEIRTFGPGFGPVERRIFSHVTRHDADSLVGLVSTRSYYLTAPPQRQRELERRVRELCATHPDLAGRDSFDLPYQTDVYRAVTDRQASRSSAYVR
jgi:SAM-dependent methyltransferase